MKIRGTIRGVAACTAFCAALVGSSQDAHAVSISSDNLDTSGNGVTDWSLYYSEGTSLAYHYGSNTALARSGGGVMLLQSSGSVSASMWKRFKWGNQNITLNVCSLQVYLKKAFTSTQPVRLTLFNTNSNTLVAQQTVNVTSTAYTFFRLQNTGNCEEAGMTVGIEAVGNGSSLAGVLVDDISINWGVPLG